MIESLIVTLREGVEAALVVGILIAYLNRVGRNHLARYVHWGLAAAVLASVAGGFALQKLAVNEEAFEGVLLLVAAVFVLSFLIWMHRVAHRLKAQIESHVDRILARGSRGAVAAGLFLVTFIMVFREGVETAVFLGAISISTDTLWTILGGLFGLSLAVGFAVLFVKGSLRINLRLFFKVTEVVLILFIVQLLINSYHELSEAGWLPASRESMALVGPMVTHNVVFIFAILAIPILVFLFSYATDGEAGPADRRERRSEVRKRLAEARRVQRTRRAGALVGLSILAFLSFDFVYGSEVPTLDPPTQLQAQDGTLVVPMSRVDDGRLHRFSYRVGGTAVRFLVIETAEDRYATVLDACELCGPIGYYQKGNRVICLNCSADIYVPSIGHSGGCNPIPIPSQRVGDNIVLQTASLAANVEVFR